MAKRNYKQASLFGPLYAYLVVLSPPAQVKADIAKIKHELNSIADITEQNLRSIAHITITDKLTDDVGFPAAIEVLLKSEKPFKIKLSSWNYFNHGHSATIYFNIVNPEPVINLMKLAGASSRTPHISLAKKYRLIHLKY